MIIKVENKEFTIEFFRKRIKNTILRIKNPNTLQITAPIYLSKEKIEHLVKVNIKWIEEQLSKKRFLYDDKIRLKGVVYKLIEKIDLEEKYYIEHDTIYYRENGIDLLLKKAFEEVRIMFYSLAKDYTNIELRFRKMRTRWGICNWKKKQITLNSLIIMLPNHLLTYIINHELSHLLIHNHQREFYIELAKIEKDYKKLQKELKEYVLL